MHQFDFPLLFVVNYQTVDIAYGKHKVIEEYKSSTNTTCPPSNGISKRPHGQNHV
jgi:hypothetical protein